jgi:hypothetical protein
MHVAERIRNSGIHIHCIDLDFNQNKIYESNRLIAAAEGLFKGLGYNVSSKPDELFATCAADSIIHKINWKSVPLLDKRSSDLNEFSRPLDRFHTKRYTVISQLTTDGDLDDDKLEKAREIGKDNEKKIDENITECMLKNNLDEPNKYVKNVKTHRSQWFD